MRVATSLGFRSGAGAGRCRQKGFFCTRAGRQASRIELPAPKRQGHQIDAITTYRRIVVANFVNVQWFGSAEGTRLALRSITHVVDDDDDDA